MIWVEQLIRVLFPTLVLEETPWHEEWEDNQRKLFLRVIRIFLPLIAVAYVLHYFFFDKPNGLEPLETWFAFRMSMAGFVAIAFAFYISPFVKLRWYKLPAIIVFSLACFSQAKVTYYYEPAPWIYPFIFLLASSLMLRLSAFQSLVWASLTMSLFLPTLISAGVDSGTLVSACLVILIVIAVIRSAYSFEIANFLLNKTNAAQQAANMELQREFSDRIKSFIPKVIADRIQSQVNSDRTSVIDASLNVLRARNAKIACLFSDIRGFTENSKNLEEFVNESVLPEVKASSDQIEKYDGIPRKIGDLIFAYFDDDSVELNVIRSILAGISLSRTNRAFNETVSRVEIRRYILISSGDAIVGNLGGIDSSVEITALGSPVNFLSRLDDATKDPKLANRLEPGDIVVCNNSAAILEDLGIDLEVSSISLAEIGLEIRDFPETRSIFVIKPSKKNWDFLSEFYERTSLQRSALIEPLSNIV